jgi:Tol biopolymer transport system component
VTPNQGSRLGHYQIVEPIGAGGMGQVFRAHDSRLGRDVALKMLPEEFARDADRLARFEREARLLAALSHPHIGAIYGVEDGDGRPALVLELVEGKTLAELIQDCGTERPLPLSEALAIARQIVDALEAAHEKGIVHRDLKPTNVKITPEGVVKVLDFGLGRASPVPGGTASSPAPTITHEETMPGAVLGTPAYMSPEQARGLPVDRRADIWAVGCVLFEMLTGEKVFDGDTASDTLAHVLTRDPEWSLLPGETPSAIRRLLRRCLQKDPRRRLRDLGDARLELEEAVTEDEQPPAAPAARAAADVRLARLTDAVGMVDSPAVSPDGKMLAFVAVGGGRRQIWIRMLVGGAPLQVTRDNADHDEPRWMRDSSTLVYHTRVPGSEVGHLWQVSALGGPPRRLAASLGGGDVSHDGRRLAFFQRCGDGIALAVAALDGSTTETILDIPPGFLCDRPRWSPDDHLIAFRRAGEFFDSRIEVVAVAGGRPVTAARAGWMRGHSWLPDGSGLVYSSSLGSTLTYPPTHNLRVVRQDGSADRQLTFGDVSYYEPDVHSSGRLLASRVRSRSEVWRFPVEGEPADNVRNATRITHQTGQIQVPSVSPDGREMVYVSDSGGHSNLWLAAADGTSVRQLTFEDDPSVMVAVPMWAPAGDRILFVRTHGARIDVCLIGSDGTGLTTPVIGAFAPCWSGDGRSIYCSRFAGQIERVDLASGAVVPVRSDRAIGPAAPRDGGALFFIRPPRLPLGDRGDTEVCRAVPEDGPADVLARVATVRVPLAPVLHLHVSVSPDGRWLGVPLLDGTTANIWLIPTEGGPMRAVTDFGERSVFIARWVSWSPDSRYVYAAVAETDADIVVLDGVLA